MANTAHGPARQTQTGEHVSASDTWACPVSDSPQRRVTRRLGPGTMSTSVGHLTRLLDASAARPRRTAPRQHGTRRPQVERCQVRAPTSPPARGRTPLWCRSWQEKACPLCPPPPAAGLAPRRDAHDARPFPQASHGVMHEFEGEDAVRTALWTGVLHAPLPRGPALTRNRPQVCRTTPLCLRRSHASFNAWP
jgi:hypothetical protein